MSLKNDLESLKAQKSAELERLHWTYLRTKRDAKRTLSPDRFIRKHLGATMGAAAVAGLLLAPKPAPRGKALEEKKTGGGGKLSGLLASILHKLGKQGQKGPAVAVAMTDRPGKPPKMGRLLEMILPLLLGKLDLTRLISELTRHFMSKKKRHEGNGHAPDMSVADAGTVKPDQYEDFQ